MTIINHIPQIHWLLSWSLLDSMVKVVGLQINVDLHFRFPFHWLWHQPQSIFDCFLKFPWNWLNLFKVFQEWPFMISYMCFIQTLIITCTIYEIVSWKFHDLELTLMSSKVKRHYVNWSPYMTSYMCFIYIFVITCTI